MDNITFYKPLINVNAHRIRIIRRNKNHRQNSHTLRHRHREHHTNQRHNLDYQHIHRSYRKHDGRKVISHKNIKVTHHKQKLNQKKHRSKKRMLRHKQFSNRKLIKRRSVHLVGKLPYRRSYHHKNKKVKRIPVLQKVQSIVVNSNGKSALIGYIGDNKKDDEEANVALHHGHVSIIWNSGHKSKYRLWNRHYRRKLGHMQSVTKYNNELAILNNPSGTVTKGQIFLFNLHTLHPVKIYKSYVKSKHLHLGDTLAYDNRNHSFYDAYSNGNIIIICKGNLHKHHGKKGIVFHRLPLTLDCHNCHNDIEVQGIAYDAKDNRLYIEISHHKNNYKFYGIRSVSVNDLKKKHAHSLKVYYLHVFTHGDQEPEGISFDHLGNMYLLIRNPERIYKINANQF